MSSRLNLEPDLLFECFCEVVCQTPKDPASAAWVLMKYPDEYTDADTLRTVPKFCYPYATANSSSTQSSVELFTFTWTDSSAKFRFGFCRRNTDGTQCMCLISYLPWHEFFYGLLNYLADLLLRKGGDDYLGFLKTAYAYPVTKILTGVSGEDGDDDAPAIEIVYKPKLVEYRPKPNEIPPPYPKLLRMMHSRILTVYVGAFETEAMLNIFASLIQERRIVMHSTRLTKLTACAHAVTALLYPMQWHHIFIPLLPQHLVDFLSAPMPFLTGIPTQLLNSSKCFQIDLADAVVVDIDAGTVKSPHNDLKDMPHAIVSMMRSGLRNQADDNVHKTFMRALVHLVGPYRNGLKMKEGEQITFDAETFIQSRPPQWQEYVRKMLQLQMFREFIQERLEILNGGRGLNDLFEQEVTAMMDAEDSGNSTAMTSTTHGNRLTGRGGGAFSQQYLHWIGSKTAKLDSFASSQLRDVRDKGRQAFSNVEHILKDFSDQLTESVVATAAAGGETGRKHHKAVRGAVAKAYHRAHSISAPRTGSGFEDDFTVSPGGEATAAPAEKQRSRKHMHSYRRPPSASMNTQLSISEPFKNYIQAKDKNLNLTAEQIAIDNAAYADVNRRNNRMSNTSNFSSSSVASSSTGSSGPPFAKGPRSGNFIFSASQAEADSRLLLHTCGADEVDSSGTLSLMFNKDSDFIRPMHAKHASSVDALLFDLDPAGFTNAAAAAVADNTINPRTFDVGITTQADKQQQQQQQQQFPDLLRHDTTNKKQHLPVVRYGNEKEEFFAVSTPRAALTSDNDSDVADCRTPRNIQQHTSVPPGGDEFFSSVPSAFDSGGGINIQQLRNITDNSSNSSSNNYTERSSVTKERDSFTTINNNYSSSFGAPSFHPVLHSSPQQLRAPGENSLTARKARASSVQPAAAVVAEQRLDSFVPLSSLHSNPSLQILSSSSSKLPPRRVPPSSASDTTIVTGKMPGESNFYQNQQNLRTQQFSSPNMLSPMSTGGRQLSAASSTKSVNSTGIASRTSQKAFDNVIGELVTKVGLKSSNGTLGGAEQRQQKLNTGTPQPQQGGFQPFSYTQQAPASPHIMRGGQTSPYFMPPQQQQFAYANALQGNPAVAAPTLSDIHTYLNSGNGANMIATQPAAALNNDVYGMLSEFSSTASVSQPNNNYSSSFNAGNSLLTAADAADDLDILLGLKPPKPIAAPQEQHQQVVAVNSNANSSINRPRGGGASNGGGGALAKIAPPITATQQRLETAAKKQQQQQAVNGAGRTHVPLSAAGEKNNKTNVPLTLPTAATAAAGAHQQQHATLSAANNAVNGFVPTHWEKFDS